MPDADNIPEFFPVSTAKRGSYSGASTVPAKPYADNTPELFAASPHHQGFHSGVLRAPDRFGKRAKLPFIPRSGRRHTFLHCTHESVGECSWMNFVRETQLQLRDDFHSCLPSDKHEASTFASLESRSDTGTTSGQDAKHRKRFVTGHSEHNQPPPLL